jgi:thiamine biosynthesis lipoprotein
MMFYSTYQRAASLLFLFVVSVSLVGCGEPAAEHFKLSGSTMGTSYHVTVLSKPDVNVSQAELQQAIDQQLLLLNQQMSTYDDNSELSQLNKAPPAIWLDLSANLFDVMMLSLELGWLSNGAFDVTVGPLVNVWGFGPGRLGEPDRVPSAASLAVLQRQVGFQHIEFNMLNNSLLKHRPVSIDLSAIAKGYGVDKVAELLDYAGYTDYMVEIGGELRLKGHSPTANQWKIAIEKPDATSMGQVQQIVGLSDVGMATSGDYRNYFEVDGIRYSHTIDPSTGYPIDHSLASVTVIAETAAYADGLATAINVMGPDKGMRLAQSQQLAVYMLVKAEQGFEVRYSKAFEPYMITP